MKIDPQIGRANMGKLLAPSRRKSKSEQTREDLLKAARVIISRDGLFNTRITDIVHFAGRSSGLFYSYFKNKKEIFSALVEEFSRELARTAPNPVDYADDPSGLVRATVVGLWQTYSEHKADVKGLFETALTDEDLRKEWQKLRSYGIRQFAYRIRKQQESGLCIGMEPELAGSALLGLLEFSFFNWEVGSLDYPAGNIDEKTAIETVVVLLQDAMQLGPEKQKL